MTDKREPLSKETMSAQLEKIDLTPEGHATVFAIHDEYQHHSEHPCGNGKVWELYT